MIAEINAKEQFVTPRIPASGDSSKYKSSCVNGRPLTQASLGFSESQHSHWISESSEYAFMGSRTVLMGGSAENLTSPPALWEGSLKIFLRQSFGLRPQIWLQKIIWKLSYNALGHCESFFGALPEGLFYLPPPSACTTVSTTSLVFSLSISRLSQMCTMYISLILVCYPPSFANCLNCPLCPALVRHLSGSAPWEGGEAGGRGRPGGQWLSGGPRRPGLSGGPRSARSY